MKMSEKKDKVEYGDTVRAEYTGRLEDGRIFAGSADGEFLEVVSGESSSIPGLKDALEGLEIGEEKTVEVDCNEAYGPSCEELKREVPRENLPSGLVVYPGRKIAMQTTGGHTIHAEIISSSEDGVLLDFNHPLAGKKLHFRLKVTDIRKG